MRLRCRAALTVVSLLATCGHALHAATYLVTNNADSGAGSLRQAVQDANRSSGGQILFSNVTGTIRLTSELPAIDGATTITGPGARSLTVSGSNTGRVFSVRGGLTLSGLTIANGKSGGGKGADAGSSPTYDGGAGVGGTNAQGGAIFNQGTTVVLDCTFQTNSVTGGNGGKGGAGTHRGGDGGLGGSGTGGAIYNLATLYLSNCTFSANTAVGGDGGAGGSGAALGAGYGGAGGSGVGAAIYNSASGSVTIIACTFDRNPARAGNSADGAPFEGFNGHSGVAGGPAQGGAICNLGRSTVLDCTFSANTATGGKGGQGGDANGHMGGDGGPGGDASGGGLYNGGFASLTNCTFTGGGAFGGDGATGGSGVLQGPGYGGVGGHGAGGALYTVTFARTDASGCTFDANTAQAGDSAEGAPFDGYNGRPGSSGTAAEGGAIANLGTNEFLNCTFYANTTTGGTGGKGGQANGRSGGNGGPGGSAYGGSLHNRGHMTVTSCTCASGTANGGTGGEGGSGLTGAGAVGASGAGYGANLANASGIVELSNSILAYPGTATNADGPITDLGHNLSSDDQPVLANSGSRNNLDPQLAALADHGGPTQTAPPSLGSPAIDTGASENAPATDQRGVPRPQGGAVDVGAVEAVTSAPLCLEPFWRNTAGFSLSVFSDSSSGYRVQGSANLRTWTNLVEVPGGGSRSFLDATATNLPSRFYRTVAP